MLSGFKHIIRLTTTLICCFFFHCNTFGQELNKSIDSLLSAKTLKPFNGVILLFQNEKEIYSKNYGYSDLEKKTPLKSNDQFVIGSICKQFTAVMVLQEFEKGRLELFVPIRKYLPWLTQSWADTVTVHHLLSHTHGIVSLNKATSFKAGTKYAYSQLGYDLLAKIIEKTSAKSFAQLSAELFKFCKMNNTFHPDIKNYTNLVKAYTEQTDGSLALDSTGFDNYPAAGTFVSTAGDLVLWNQKLQNNELLKAGTLKMMLTKQANAIRQHPLFGLTEYGYGITVDTKDGLLQLGQTGFSPGFVSMNFYFPETKTSVVVLENVSFDRKDLKNTFFYHLEILKIVRKELKAE